MRLSELLGVAVLCQGEQVGRVVDVRLVLIDSAQPELMGIIVGDHRGAAFLGYERRSTNRPAIVNRFMAWRQRRSFLVEWADVRSLGTTVELEPGFGRWSAQL